MRSVMPLILLTSLGLAPFAAGADATENTPADSVAGPVDTAELVVAAGRTVGIVYTVTLSDGTVADTNVDGDPLVFTQGEGQVLPALETQLSGLAPGARKRVELAAVDAYGEVDPEQFKDIPSDRIPEDSRVVGALLTATRIDGQTHQVRVVAVEDGNIVLDFNHPLAGQDLVFDVEIVSVE